MILFNDSEWKYNFLILMTVIIIVCGIYTITKVLLQNKKQNKLESNKNKDNK